MSFLGVRGKLLDDFDKSTATLVGGWGSGIYRPAGACLDTELSMDVRQFARRNLLQVGRISDWSWSKNGIALLEIQVSAQPDTLILRRKAPADSVRQVGVVELTNTGCNFGGARAWFLCPGCGRRVAILYVSAALVCRRCLRQSYRSQRERAFGRMVRRVDKVRQQLGWPCGLLNSDGTKPKGMHWKTYARLKKEHDRLVGACLGDIDAQLVRLGKRP